MESGLNDGIALPPILVCFAALGAWLLQQAAAKDWIDGTFQRLAALSLALVTFALAESVGGNGFIAAFCAGLTLGAQRLTMIHSIQEAGEAEGTMLSLGVFLLLGLAAIPAFIDYWGWREILYAVLSLTVIRMVPVAIALIGAKLDRPTTLFVGWFGPRGIASVLYLLLAASAIGVAGHEHMMSVIVLTVALSVLLHGISAVPFCRSYARRLTGHDT